MQEGVVKKGIDKHMHECKPARVVLVKTGTVVNTISVGN